MKEIITIQISKFLTNELVEKITQKQYGKITPASLKRVRQCVFDEIANENDCFGVVAKTNEDVIGRLHCIKNENNSHLWYYGDLFVVPEYRKMGIATQMLRAAINHLSEMGVHTLRCYVEPNNVPSRNLQKSMGFLEKPLETFNNLMNDGLVMYEVQIPSPFSVIRATIEEAYFVRILFVQNREKLKVGNITLNEWREILSADNSDEAHLLICKGAMPVAYMKINGLDSERIVRISMLFVAKGFQYQEIENYAMKYAQNFMKEKRNLKNII